MCNQPVAPLKLEMPEENKHAGKRQRSGAEAENIGEQHDPRLKRLRPYNTGRWTEKEHQDFLKGLRKYGKNWDMLAYSVLTRSATQVRSHAQKYFQKCASQYSSEVPSEYVSLKQNSAILDACYGPADSYQHNSTKSFPSAEIKSPSPYEVLPDPRSFRHPVVEKRIAQARAFKTASNNDLKNDRLIRQLSNIEASLNEILSDASYIDERDWKVDPLPFKPLQRADSYQSTFSDFDLIELVSEHI